MNSDAGPVLADTGALFNATALTTGGGHANLLTTALSYSQLLTIRTAMRKQTDQVLGVGRRLGFAPKYLMVPIDLENTADHILGSKMVPSQSGGATTGGELQTENALFGKLTKIVVPQWTDVNNYAVLADPKVAPVIWLIWLRGRRTPEIFAADDERSGAMFTNDEIRYKVRMFSYQYSSTYDCAPVSDFRGVHKSNVA